MVVIDHDDIVKEVEEHIYKNPIHFKPSAHYSYSEQGRLFHFTVGGDNLQKTLLRAVPEWDTKSAPKSTAAL